MRLDVSGGAEEGSHALFDPALLLDAHGADPRAELEREVEAGRALVLDTGDEDLEYFDYAVFVEESLPPDVATRVTRLTADVLLRAPTGRLRATSVDEVTVDDAERGGTLLELPAGDYLVDVFRTSFGPEDLHAALRAEPETEAGFRRERWVGPVFGLLVIVGILACLAGLALGLEAGGGVGVWGAPDPSATAAVLRAARFIAGGLLAFGLAAGWSWLLLPGEAYRRRKQAMAARFPAVALHLRRAPAGHGARGARVGLLAE